MGIVIGLILLGIWFLLPAVLVARSKKTPPGKKLIWIMATFAPHAALFGGNYVASKIPSMAQWINLMTGDGGTYFGIFFYVTFFLGGWPVLALHDTLYKSAIRQSDA